MENKLSEEKTEPKRLNIILPEELLERVRAFCAEREMTILEFLHDAVIEKLELAYKEKRKRPRL
jgi:hypothetical protein